MEAAIAVFVPEIVQFCVSTQGGTEVNQIVIGQPNHLLQPLRLVN